MMAYSCTWQGIFHVMDGQLERRSMERKIEFRLMTVAYAGSETINLDDALTLLPFLLAASTLQTINYSCP